MGAMLVDPSDPDRILAPDMGNDRTAERHGQRAGEVLLTLRTKHALTVPASPYPRSRFHAPL